MLIYSFQLLDRSKGRGGSEEFYYGIMLAPKLSWCPFVFVSLLYKYGKLFVSYGRVVSQFI